MNPIDSYRDPGLDGLVDPYVPTGRKPSRHSRHTSTATREAYPPPANMPTAPEVPRGATIAYPGTDLTGQGVQRSFSQRARGRPYAEEAFADESLADNGRQNQLQSQPHPRQVSAQEPLAMAPQPERQSSRRQQMIQNNIQSAADAVRSPKDQPDRGIAPTASAHAYDSIENPIPSLAKAPTTREAASPSDQREWAPDRSPLQKLEVTLNDISKEEKRARVQEAEMLHREKTRSQRPSTRDNPPTIEDVGMVRGLSNAHKDRLQHSTVIESRKPDATRLSSDRRGFEYQSAALPVRSVTITRRSRQSGASQPGVSQPSTVPQRAASSSQAQPYQEPMPTSSQSRSVSATQPEARSVPTERLSSQGSRRSRQKPVYDLEGIPTAQERNASHRAALEQLTGVSTAPPTRSASGKARDTLDARAPRTSGRTSANRDIPASNIQETARTRAAQPVPPSTQTAMPQAQNAPVGLGVQGSPAMRSVDSPVPFDSGANTVQKHKRRSSVSFKEPYDRRRPVDEWKAAETAKLSADDFLLEAQPDATRNKAWWEEDTKSRRRSSRSRAAALSENVVIDDRVAEFKPKLFVKCGPLLRYTGMKRTVGEGAKEYWRGTVMLVTQDSQSSYEKPPTLRLFAQPKSFYTPPEPAAEAEDDDVSQDEHDPLAGTIKMSRIGRALYVRPVHSLTPERDLSRIETDDGLYESAPPIANADEHTVSVAPVVSRLSENNGERYGRYKEIKGVRLYADPDRDVTFWLFKLEIQLGPEQRHIGYRINGGAASGFWIPAEGQTMNMMFHSCNGFSLSVKPDEFSGPDPLWRDVLNAHQSRPFHVMIGGGDQIYNDKAMRDTRYFGDWTANRNPNYKHRAPFTPEMKEELESFYLENYSQWFSSGLFAMAGAQIPMVNMWDDHDIIDGFGSYPDHFMVSPVFSGIGNVAFKYYMLFQQHSVETMTSADEPSWILGYQRGPYIKQLSRSIFLDFGKPVAFLALDCRTERMKNQVLSEDSFDIALERCRKEIIEGQTKHLILLLGVPIAYPRMNWLENVLTSRAMDPVKALGRYGVIKGGFLNRFDGGVEVLDDLDDHWTAQHHKQERNDFVLDLQELAAEKSVRITILGGDVHLAAIGQFYSNPKLKIPKDRDHRYMPNVISSAIVNTPPPEMLADVLNKRNKIHHLDSYTDESMIPMFTHDVDLKKRNNKHLLPRRNWCSISEYVPGRTPPSSRGSSPSRSDSPSPEDNQQYPQPKRRFSLSRDDVNPRMMFRRLSSRNAPPTAYREGGYPAEEGDQRAASFDETRGGRSGQRSWNERLGFTRRTASETREPVVNGTNQSNEEFNSRRPPPFRPGFHRRPTNLSEKAAKKGNIPAVDAEGNEFDVNDHVNLDGGLDIVLNCEIDRKDPRGNTEPYRLLIPALWYDGSSDREKLDDASGLQRKPTLMNRLGLGGPRGHKAAQNQGAGNWGQDMSETESYSDSEGDIDDRPKKKFGLFGSLRKKRTENEEVDGRDMPSHFGTAAGIPAEPADFDQKTSATVPATVHSQVTAPATTTPKDTPPRMSHQAAPAGYDMPYDMPDQPQETSRAFFNRPPSQSRKIMEPAPYRTSSLKGTNVLRKNSAKRQAAADRNFAAAAPISAQYQTEPVPQSHPQARTIPSEPISPTIDRQNSYTIGSSRSRGSRHPGQASSAPYDADSAYLSTNGQPATRAVSNPVSSGPSSSFPTQPHPDDVQRGHSLRTASMGIASRFGRRDPAPGSATDHDTFAGNPQQRSLRGNGILGRFGLGKYSASADQVPTQRNQNLEQGPAQPQPQSQDDFAAPQRTLSQGYSGIEAYRDKPKRGLSLRDRARNLIDRMEGRRGYDDDGDYDDGASYSSEESYSSAGVGEVEGGVQQADQGRRNRLQKPNQDPVSARNGDNRPPQPPQPQLQRQQNHPQHHSNNDEEQDMYSDDGTGSYLSEEMDREEYGQPKRGLSQRFKMGMMRMGSSSKRTGEASRWKNAFGSQRDRGAAEERQLKHYY